MQDHGVEKVKEALDLEPKTKDPDAKRPPTEKEILDVVEKRVGKAFAAVLKAKRWGKNKKANAEKAKGTNVTDSEYNDKFVRVVAEVPEQGRTGHVCNVYASKLTAEYRLHVMDGGENGGTFTVSSKDVVVESSVGKKIEMAPFKINYRTVSMATRLAIHGRLVGSEDGNLERLVKNVTIEQTSLSALLHELRTRFKTGPEIRIFEPSVSTVYSYEPGGDDHGGENVKFSDELLASKHVFFVVWAASPSHYTYIYTRKPEGDEPRLVEYKDSLKPAADTSRAAATRLLRNLKLAEECPEPCNRAFQSDGWSCGLWTVRWIERQLREIAGEPRMKPPSIMDVFGRGQEFIDKVKLAKPKATKPKAKSVAKVYKNPEPTFATLEEALTAAHKCTKCLPTKALTKGCRQCMGEWFEHIRQKGFK